MTTQKFLDILFAAELLPGDLDILHEASDDAPGSVPWNPYPTLQEVLDSLERAAATLRQREGAPPLTVALVMSEAEGGDE